MKRACLLFALVGFGCGSDPSGTSVDAGPSTADREPQSDPDAMPIGDDAELRDVVISEINWYGNDDGNDEWIELHNTTAAPLNLNQWTLEGAGTANNPNLVLPAGTVIGAGEYLVIGSQQGAVGAETSLTGVTGVQVLSIELSNAGEVLRLRDPDGTFIDETPMGPWAAGSNQNDLSMERRDDASGGGYTDGSVAQAWYTWSSLDTVDTTNALSSDRGTPGAANSNPDLFDHFSFEITPSPARAATDFTVTVTAYTSSDDTIVADGYTGTITTTASAGTLSGDAESASITSGVATLNLQIAAPDTGVTLTTTDDVYGDIIGTSQSFDIGPEGDIAALRDVVISEINWTGNDGSTLDEWIELENTSGGPIILAGWTLENALSGDLTIPSGTTLGAGERLVLGRLQGPDTDTMRTSLTGVANVQIHIISLANGGEVLSLRDVAGTLIDSTPAGAWPAGDNTAAGQRSMERSDSSADGSLTSSWHTWRVAGASDTTNADSTDQGTPGAANTPPPTTLYSSSFETGEANFELAAGAGTFSNTPPAGTAARTGTGVISNSSITTSFTGREIQSIDCIALTGSPDPIAASIFASASTDNGGNVLRARWRILWFDEGTCTTANAIPDATTNSLVLETGYLNVPFAGLPPLGATHMKVRLELRDDNGDPNDGDDWSADDVSIRQ